MTTIVLLCVNILYFSILPFFADLVQLLTVFYFQMPNHAVSI